MPPFVTLLAENPDLFNEVARVLTSHAQFVRADDHLSNTNTYGLIYPVSTTKAEWDGWEEEDGARQVPEPWTYSQLLFETRSPEMLVDVGNLLSAHILSTIWVCDSAQHLYPADASDLSGASIW